MPPEKGDAAYLWDMLDAARAVREFVTGRTFHDDSCRLNRTQERRTDRLGDRILSRTDGRSTER